MCVYVCVCVCVRASVLQACACVLHVGMRAFVRACFMYFMRVGGRAGVGLLVDCVCVRTKVRIEGA